MANIYTNTRIVSVSLNDLGTIFKVDEPKESDDYQQWQYNRRVYFRPANGVHIDYLVRRTRYIDTNADGTRTERTSDWGKSNFSYIKEGDYRGCCDLGIEYRNTQNGFFEGAYDIIDEVEVSGSSNYLNLELVGKNAGIGSDDRYFSYSYYSNPNSDTSEAVYRAAVIYRSSSEERMYTNLVAFNSSIASKESFVCQGSVQDNKVHSETFSQILSNTHQTSSTLFVEFQYDSYDRNRSENWTVQLYENCYLALFCLNPQTKLEQTEHPETTYSKYYLQVRTIYQNLSNKLTNGEADAEFVKQHSGWGYWFKVANALVSLKTGNTWKSLYPSYEIYEQAQRLQKNLPHMVDSSSGAIPSNLLWVENLKDPSGEGISRYTHIVRLVYVEEPPTIVSIAYAGSEYARYTNFWHVLGTYYNNEKNWTQHKIKYLNENDILPSETGNVYVSPVFKPYAECMLEWFDKEGRKPEDERVFTRRHANFYHEYLDSKYRHLGKTYAKSIPVDVEESVASSRDKFKKFALTVSPYKNIIFDCHGGRDQYVENQPNSGKAYICTSTRSWLSTLGMKKRMDASMYWWSEEDWGSKQKLGLFVDSCYGQGFRNQATSTSFGNCVLTDPKEILPDFDDVFYIIGAISTHFNFGSKKMTLQLPAMTIAAEECKKPGSGSVYARFCNAFNNTVGNFSKSAFAMIKKFYNEYWTDLLNSIPEQDLEMWVDTKGLILDDLDNQGEKYFCMPYYEEGDTQNNSSDEYFIVDAVEDDDHHEPEKRYRIHDGFVGLIRHDVFGTDWNNKRKYFIEIKEDDVLSHLAYQKSIDRVKNGIRELRDKIYNQMTKVLKQRYPMWVAKIALTHPVAGCTGAFSTGNQTTFMANPDSGQDSWLSSDEDLGRLCNLTSNFVYL